MVQTDRQPTGRELHGRNWLLAASLVIFANYNPAGAQTSIMVRTREYLIATKSLLTQASCGLPGINRI